MLTHSPQQDKSNKLIGWMEGAFDAIQKKYLRQLVLLISTEDVDQSTVIESYIFKFGYNPDGSTVLDAYNSNGTKIGSTEAIKKPTLKLLRSVIMVTHSLDPLPEDVVISMRLSYYEDAVPEGYEPPGFKEAESDELYYGEETPTSIRLGKVDTGYHTVLVRVKTAGNQFLADPVVESSQQTITDESSQQTITEDDAREEVETHSDHEYQIEESLLPAPSTVVADANQIDNVNLPPYTPSINSSVNEEGSPDARPSAEEIMYRTPSLMRQMFFSPHMRRQRSVRCRYGT